MLTHRLNPMQSQTVQHSRRALHDHQDGNRQDEPQVEERNGSDDPHGTGLRKGDAERHAPEDNGELLMGEGKGPEAEVGGSVGHAVETKFCGKVLVGKES